MSSRNKFLRKGLCVAGSSIAAAGSLFSTAGVEAAGNVVLEKQLKEVLSKDLWYIILKSLNFWGMFSKKIEKIENEQLKRIDESEKKKKIDCINKVIENVGLSYDPKDKVLEEAWNGNKENTDKKEMFRSQVKCVKSVGKSLCSVCYDDNTETYTLLKLVNGELVVKYKFCEVSSKFEDAEKFYKELMKVFFEDEYNKIVKDFCDFLDRESSIKEKKGLFEKIVFERNALFYDFNFGCYIGGNRLNFVSIWKEDNGICDIRVVYNFGPGRVSERYEVGENGLSKGEMAMYLKDIMEQAKKYKQEQKDTKLVSSASTASVVGN